MQLLCRGCRDGVVMTEVAAIGGGVDMAATVAMDPEDVIEVEDMVELEDETVPASVYEVGESSTAPFLRVDNDGLLPDFMRRDINSLFGLMASLSRRLVEEETAAIENLVKKLGDAEEKAKCKKLKQELEEARFSKTLLQRPNEAIDVPVKDEKSPSSEPRGSPRDS
ncbi:hypothetical protein Tco_0751854 [Tanacetum coccineum]|uniref:Uncharacterized protein n=1 Tax=Tanacetum coccineum TaxID=301880 RepID=A0ABQ4Z8V0_9ASTR